MLTRWSLALGGLVQGVGFRPFVYRLARQHALAGRVCNSAAGVEIELEGPRPRLVAFLDDLQRQAPPAAVIEHLERRELPPVGEQGFVIADTQCGGPPVAGVVPDLAVCADCLAEMLDPADRRYLYPFINCTNCGPRYTIIEKIPYDRPHTTMRVFTMCRRCQAEYDDPASRRFHAQPNACPDCGPALALVSLNQQRQDKAPPPLAAGPSAVAETRRRLLAGEIVAIKGIGGFHLAVNGADQAAVKRLRRRKGRPDKPLALMVRDLATARGLVQLGPMEENLLVSPARPIVLALRQAAALPVAAAVAPGNRRLGLMLAYAPLHHLLLDSELPLLVMTSANPSSEPLCIDNDEACRRLSSIADAVLLHDRAIVRGNDDSVIMQGPVKVIGCGTGVGAANPGSGSFSAGILPASEVPAASCASMRPAAGKPAATGIGAPRPSSTLTLPWVIMAGNDRHPGAAPLVIRRGRGYAPGLLPFSHRGAAVLAVGGELKNTVCLAADGRAVISQHLGDLQNLESYRVFGQTIADLSQLFAIQPQVVAYDLHPDYLASRWARQWAAEQGLPAVAVQHHHAHLAACLAENEHQGPALGLILDGTGYGPDGSIWGGEILLGDAGGFSRWGHLETMPLPGGDLAVRQPWRAALGFLYQAFAGDIPPLPFLAELQAADKVDWQALLPPLRQNINCPRTSSCGRLFDAVAAMAGGCQKISYEAQAAVELMQAADGLQGPPFAYRLIENKVTEYGFHGAGGPGVLMQLSPLVCEVAAAVSAGAGLTEISRRFHATLVDMFTAALVTAATATGIKTVALAGGVMQNEVLLAGLKDSLAQAGLAAMLPRRLPSNDGGLAYGQAVVAATVSEQPHRIFG
ncbi:carbamoyltransferase HypF [Desulfurivibrio alkaliphilus]|uniref:acylphosphatase n=1 Tax=Desulfurivibrio alkaliphilus (strain DSM 19089 / UNIQEM U267 / AHT2) TaxID=589865 RepID=D6Z6H7_DESAT|nr:carbamoyltransferase HypF [Desulfurivibrio alkaliphilus]ADH84936.1 (NiFe) hydrogenase maturation protein HypF [Desulfurivibrio alkaliphilus AHT 2]